MDFHVTNVVSELRSSLETESLMQQESRGRLGLKEGEDLEGAMKEAMWLHWSSINRKIPVPIQEPPRLALQHDVQQGLDPRYPLLYPLPSELEQAEREQERRKEELKPLWDIMHPRAQAFANQRIRRAYEQHASN